MSAWDVAGAVVWTLGTLGWAVNVPVLLKKGQPGLAAINIGLALFGLAADAYCIARLCGAHA